MVRPAGSTIRQLRSLDARFRASAALRRLRHDRRRGAQLLRRLLEADRVPWRSAAARRADCRSQATEADNCAVCLAKPPRIARTRAAVAYDELSREPRAAPQIWAQGRPRADHGALHGAADRQLPSDALLVPVPLHRRGCGSAGSTSRRSSLASLSRRLGLPSDALALRRIKRTPPLKGMSLRSGASAVAGAFRSRDAAAVQGGP